MPPLRGTLPDQATSPLVPTRAAEAMEPINTATSAGTELSLTRAVSTVSVEPTSMLTSGASGAGSSETSSTDAVSVADGAEGAGGARGGAGRVEWAERSDRAERASVDVVVGRVDANGDKVVGQLSISEDTLGRG